MGAFGSPRQTLFLIRAFVFVPKHNTLPVVSVSIKWVADGLGLTQWAVCSFRTDGNKITVFYLILEQSDNLLSSLQMIEHGTAGDLRHIIA